MLRRLVRVLARTPLHPQWLLGKRKPPRGVADIPGHVLDIGCADCWVRAHLHESASYVALDYPKTGRDLYGARPSVFGDGAQIPIRDGCMNAVVCLEVLEHVPDPAGVFREISRVLVPGGKAWITMPFLYPVHDAPYDFQRYTQYGLLRDAAAAGLTAVRLEKRGHAVATAGLMACLAFTGPFIGGSRRWAWILLPVVGVLVLLTNLAAFVMSKLLPDWDGMCFGHSLELIKPVPVPCPGSPSA